METNYNDLIKALTSPQDKISLAGAVHYVNTFLKHTYVKKLQRF